MDLISKPNLFEAARATKNPQVLEKATRWYELTAKNDFESFVALRKVFPSIDLAGNKLAFDLGSYRLICGVSFIRRTLYIKALLSHDEYNKGAWK